MRCSGRGSSPAILRLRSAWRCACVSKDDERGNLGGLAKVRGRRETMGSITWMWGRRGRGRSGIAWAYWVLFELILHFLTRDVVPSMLAVESVLQSMPTTSESSPLRHPTQTAEQSSSCDLPGWRTDAACCHGVLALLLCHKAPRSKLANQNCQPCQSRWNDV
uniref:Uncharacterized protein n=1 Tax=Triticum urartu TaxID=4572 RepID=A0A8R7UL20_TRIUA